jgi:energy-coupling factor transport system permease protein
MFNNISLGTYYPGKSLLHRLQARTKLLVQFFIVVSLVIAGQRQWHFLPFIVIVTLLLISILCSRISPHELWRRMWLLALITLLGAVVALFSLSGDGDKVLYALGPLNIAYGLARQNALLFALAILLILIAFYLPPLRPIRRKTWPRRIRFWLFLLLIVASIFLWVVRDNPALQNLEIGPLPITYSGVWALVSFTVVLLTLYAFSLLLTMTTSPVALIEGLSMLLAPLRRLKLPVDDFALMTLIALRFIPTLLEEVDQLIKAQTARGADLTHGTLRERVQSLTLLFVPLMQGILRRASELATALEARGYESNGHQTRLYERALGRIDYVVLGVVLVATMGSLVF